MTAEKYWFENAPAQLARERAILAHAGFQIDDAALSERQLVRFRGVLSNHPDVELTIEYPDSFPSKHPTVIAPTGTLGRHQNPSDGTLCCFGFAGERWDATCSAIDLLREIDDLIGQFQDGTTIPDSDVVPEPYISTLPYAPGAVLLVPPPLGELTDSELGSSATCKMLMNRSGDIVRTVATRINGTSGVIKAKDVSDGWVYPPRGAEPRMAPVRTVDSRPPLDPSQLKGWLEEREIQAPGRATEWLILRFPDEAGQRDRTVMRWLGVHRADGKLRYVRTQQVSRDDLLVRSPRSTTLREFKVMFVGCGSLGAQVAIALAQEGVGELTLVDSELFEAGNAVRHPLEMPVAGLPKTTALQTRIERISPFPKVKMINTKVGAWTGNESGRSKFFRTLANIDLVVDTTGSHSTSHYLNRVCHSHGVGLFVASVTNGAWACEVVQSISDEAGCWLCWARQYENQEPPGEPVGQNIFAPGCSQPTFHGGAASLLAAGGFVAETLVECLTNGASLGREYAVLRLRNADGSWEPSVDVRSVGKMLDCAICG